MSRLVHLRPVDGRFIPGVAAIDQDVTPEEAEILLAYTPAAFTADHPKAPRPDRPPPEPPAVKPPEIPVEEAGITDSRE